MPMFYDRLHEAVEILHEFFHNDGHGLTGDWLDTTTYQNLKLNFCLNKMSTESLIDRYLVERLGECQKSMETGTGCYGTLSVRTYYHHDCLFVEVLKAQNLIPLDNNGLSDPFVVVEILPRTRFASTPAQQTNVQKANLNPVFEECLEFPVSAEECQDEVAMIQFSVYDYDVLTANDFGGEAMIGLASVPGVQCGNSYVGNFHGLKQIHLPLLFQHNKDHPILKVLELRTQDKLAQEFVKKNKERIRKA